ncbi:MAG: exodeoxyribonuclease III [Oscillospiraceae bacterium]
MRLISWNVNGLRAVVKKGFEEAFLGLDADIFCLQETKLQEGQISLDLPLWENYWSYAQKKGYSGTAVFTKKAPLSTATPLLGVTEPDTEGRIVTLEYQEFFLVCVYVPNSQDELKRLSVRLEWEDAFRAYVSDLDKQKPVIICGDMNVAHEEIDLKNPKTNHGNAGFSDQERAAFTKLLDAGFTDSFRFLYPETTAAYSWWSYRANARANNAGWRIDYFLVSNRLRDNIEKAFICPEILGSDHCPVGLDINF